MMDSFWLVSPLSFSSIVLGCIIFACLGSFVTTWIDRLPKAENRKEAWVSIFQGRSQCPACRKALKASHLVPVVSWLFLRGRCGFCGQKISSVYPITEIGAVLIFLLSVYWGESASQQLIYGILGLLLWALAIIDWRDRILPNELVASVLVLGVVMTIIAPWSLLTMTQSLIGIFVAGGLFWLVRTGYALIRQREGMGQGDVKLAAAGGAWIGVIGLADMILWACALTLLLAFVMSIRGKKLNKYLVIPFGPGLALGVYLTAVAHLSLSQIIVEALSVWL